MKAKQFFGFVLFFCGIVTAIMPFLINIPISPVRAVIVSIIIFISGFTTGFIGLGFVTKYL